MPVENFDNHNYNNNNYNICSSRRKKVNAFVNIIFFHLIYRQKTDKSNRKDRRSKAEIFNKNKSEAKVFYEDEKLIDQVFDEIKIIIYDF